MPTVFNANNLIEAQLVADLLTQSNLDARVEGAHLAGAIGDLPVTGILRVVVPEEDVQLAKDLITQWENGAFALSDDTIVGDAPPDGEAP